jgi:two-component system, chemotaxis family, CheB/CheR fusion protein
MPKLRLKVDMGGLEQNMLDVIKHVQPQQLRVQNNDGQWCILRIVPYRTMDNRIDGVVLTVVDKSTFGGDHATDGSVPERKSAAARESAGNKMRPK